MEVRELLERLRDQMTENLTVQRVFGEPYTVGNKTIIPVARIGFGMGAGGGRKKDASEAVAGGGGGGGAEAIGVLEVTCEQTRFISFKDKRKLAATAAAGLFLGWWLGRRRN